MEGYTRGSDTQPPCFSPIHHLPGSCVHSQILNAPSVLFLWVSAQAETLASGLLLSHPAFFPWLIAINFPNSGKKTFTCMADLPPHSLWSQRHPPLVSTWSLACSELACTSVVVHGLWACLLALLHCGLSIRKKRHSFGHHMCFHLVSPTLSTMPGTVVPGTEWPGYQAGMSPVSCSIWEDMFNVIIR